MRWQNKCLGKSAPGWHWLATRAIGMPSQIDLLRASGAKQLFRNSSGPARCLVSSLFISFQRAIRHACTFFHVVEQFLFIPRAAVMFVVLICGQHWQSQYSLACPIFLASLLSDGRGHVSSPLRWTSIVFDWQEVAKIQ